MKISITIASILLFVFIAQVSGLVYETEGGETAANDSINATQINETASNATITNETLANATLNNINLTNVTPDNASLSQNESDPFANAKNRKPSQR